MPCCEHCAELQRRVAALEEMVFRKHAARIAILDLLRAWPGPFTVQQIEAALKERKLEISAGPGPALTKWELEEKEKAAAAVADSALRTPQSPLNP